MDPPTPFKRVGPVSRLKDFVTPTATVHVLAHLGVARVDPAQWRLSIDGMVEQPLELDLDELLRLPARELSAVFECYGNPLEPDVAARSVANLVWRGVSLRTLLERAGVRPEARFVWLEGLDSGTFAGTDCERYVKDIPVARALRDDVLVAYAMNGEPLTAEHGAPARIVVPDYFGTSAVKWLSRVRLAAARPEGLFTTRLYNRRAEGRAHAEPAQELDVNAVIVRPGDQDCLTPGRHLISGWAWSTSEISNVEVSTDDGASWHATHVVARGPAPTWQRFGFEWDVAIPGVYEIRARATDIRGRVQPNRGRNAVHTVSVRVAP